MARTWRDAVEALRAAASAATEHQIQVADALGIELDPATPKTVALVRIVQELVADAELPQMVRHDRRLHSATFWEDWPVSESQQDFLATLASRLTDDDLTEIIGCADPEDIAPQNRADAMAWIHHLRMLVRIRTLEENKFSEGDIVRRSPGSRSLSEELVSSVGLDGRLHFRGVGNAGADRVELLHRRDDDTHSANRVREAIANRNSDRRTRDEWSAAKHKELIRFYVEDSATTEDVDELEQVINDASEEKPIQEFLEERPQLLAILLSGRPRYVLPKVRLDGRFEADFFLADADSLGITWWFVELETPNSAVLTRSGNHEDLEAHAREGVSQIKHWREFIEARREHARKSKREGGLGLFDVRSNSRGIVLVGRRATFNHRGRDEVVRHQERERFDIHVHTYDWLLDRLRARIREPRSSIDDAFSVPDKDTRLHLLERTRREPDEIDLPVSRKRRRRRTP